MNDICQIQKQIQKVPPCIWKYTRLFGLSHTRVVFTKRLEKSQVFGKKHTCVVFTKHLDRCRLCGKIPHMCGFYHIHGFKGGEGGFSLKKSIHFGKLRCLLREVAKKLINTVASTHFKSISFVILFLVWKQTALLKCNN